MFKFNRLHVSFRCEFVFACVSGAGPPGGLLFPGADLRVLFVYIHIDNFRWTNVFIEFGRSPLSEGRHDFLYQSVQCTLAGTARRQRVV